VLLENRYVVAKAFLRKVGRFSPEAISNGWGLDVKRHYDRGTDSDAKFRLMALDDPDLEPLWASLAAD